MAGGKSASFTADHRNSFQQHGELFSDVSTVPSQYNSQIENVIEEIAVLVIPNMEEDVIIQQLVEQSLHSRAYILQYLRNELRKNGGRLQFEQKLSLFNALGYGLADPKWEIRNNVVILLNELIPQFGQELDACMQVVLPKVISNLGHSKIRRAVLQTIHVYMKHTKNVQAVFHALVKYGVESNDPVVRRETTIGLPMLFTPEFAREDLFVLVHALLLCLKDAAGDETAQQPILVSLEKLNELVGEKKFLGLLKRLPDNLLRYYCRITNRDVDVFTGSSGLDVDPEINKLRLRSNSVSQLNNLLFGFVPAEVVTALSDNTDWKARVQGVEELKVLLKHLDNINPLVSNNLNSFISFLSELLDDVNFKVRSTTLEIFELLVSKLKTAVKPVLKPVIAALSKNIGDNKSMVKQENMRVIMQLMQTLSPKPVLTVVCDHNLKIKNSNVRQETLNIVIAALLTFPSYEFDLNWLCRTIAPTVIDGKRKVRHASLECLAVIAQALGSAKMQTLIQAVEGVEASKDGDGALAAVLARVARRVLPRLSTDGVVEYAVVTTACSASMRDKALSHGADVDWILAGAGGGSARPVKQDVGAASDATSDTSSVSSLKLYGISPKDSPVGTPIRYHSSGRRGRQLPWDDALDASFPGTSAYTHVDRWPEDVPHFATIRPNQIHSERHRASLDIDFCRKPGNFFPTEKPVFGSLSTTPQCDTLPVLSMSLASRHKEKPKKPMSDSMKQIGTFPPGVGQNSKKRCLSEPSSPVLTDVPVHQKSLLSDSTQTRKVIHRVRTDSDVIPTESSFSFPPTKPVLAKPKNKSLRQSLRMFFACSSDQPTSTSFYYVEPGKDGKGVSVNGQIGKTAEVKQDYQRTGRKVVQEVKKVDQSLQKKISPEVKPDSQAFGKKIVSNDRHEDESIGKKVTSEVKRESQLNAKKAVPQQASTKVVEDADVAREREEARRRYLQQQEQKMERQMKLKQINSQQSKDKANGELVKTVELEDHKLLEVNAPRQSSPVGVTTFATANGVVTKPVGIKQQKSQEIQMSSPHSPSKAPVEAGITESEGTERRKSLRRSVQANGQLPKSKDDVKTSLELTSAKDKEITNPEKLIKTALANLSSSEWEPKVDGLQAIQRLSVNSPDTVNAQLHTVILAVVNEVKNLRSQVSRVAMGCLADMYRNLHKQMDLDLDMTTKILLQKNGESNAFIRDESENALAVMVDEVSPQRAVLALILGGAFHKNGHVKTTTSKYLAILIERLGAAKVLSGQKDLTDRVIPAVAAFAVDGSQETRANAKKILYLLLDHPEFEKALEKYLNPTQIRNVKDKVNDIRAKGLGDDTSNDGSDGSPEQEEHRAPVIKKAPVKKQPSVRKRPAGRIEGSNITKDITDKIGSSDWRQKCEGMEKLQQVCNEKPHIISTDVVKIFDKLVPRLSDTNSKVNLLALQTLQQMIPLLNNDLQPVISAVVGPLTFCLASKNTNIESTASDVLDLLMSNLEYSTLLQPFANQAQYGNPKGKPTMVMRVAAIATELYPHKQNFVSRYALPLLWDLLNQIKVTGTSELRGATEHLVTSLYSVMGPKLLEVADVKHKSVLNNILTVS